MINQPKMLASREYIEALINRQLALQGYVAKGDYGQKTVCEAAPCKVETCRGGLLWLTTYHRSFFMAVFKFRLCEVDSGNIERQFALEVSIPEVSSIREEVDEFLEGLNGMLKTGVNCRDFTEIIDLSFIRILLPAPIIEVKP
jgi:hypothetical protein